MSHRGLAREAAVALRREFRDPEAGLAVAGGDDAGRRRSRRCVIEEPSLCDRYSARVIEGLRVRPVGARVGERLSALDAGLDLVSGRRDESRPLGHRPAAPRLRPRHAGEGRERPPDDRRPEGAPRGEARDAGRRRADAHARAPRHRGREEAGRPRRDHGRARDGHLGADDAGSPRVGALRPGRRPARVPPPRDAHGRLASLRARDRSRGDASTGSTAPRG